MLFENIIGILGILAGIYVLYVIKKSIQRGQIELTLVNDKTFYKFQPKS
jgi:xanthosine utilization system XapX-like protein